MMPRIAESLFVSVQQTTQLIHGTSIDYQETH